MEINFSVSKIHWQKIQMKKMIFEEQSIGHQSAQAQNLNSLCHLADSKSFVACFLASGRMRAAKEDDPWLKFSNAVDEFNEICKMRVKSSLWISCDESMSAWKPRKTALGDFQIFLL